MSLEFKKFLWDGSRGTAVEFRRSEFDSPRAHSPLNIARTIDQKQTNKISFG